MSSENVIRPGDSVSINGIEVTVGVRRSVTGLRWTWGAAEANLTGDGYYTTAQEAIDAAHRTLGAPVCQHGRHGWCPDCHDLEGR